MVQFVLVHGGSHAAWCWDRLLPHLTEDARVSSAIAVDLCGHGTRENERPQDDITIADYVRSVVNEIDSRSLENIILVGHSLAGILIPHVAHERPKQMRRLVYLSTTNPPMGTSVNDSMTHPLSPVTRGVDVTAAFCSDLDDETTAWLLGRLGPQPPGVLAETVTRVAGPSDIPSTYVLLEEDEVLPPDYQLEQAETIGVDEVVRFSAGHSAFASRPKDLATLLCSMI